MCRRDVWVLLMMGFLVLGCGGTETVPAPDVGADVTPPPDTVTPPPDLGPPPDCLANADCNDTNQCTLNTCQAGVCVTTESTDVCDDGDTCTTADRCAAGLCAGEPLNCDDGNTCTKDYCWEGACTNVPLDDAACALVVTVDTPERGATLNGVSTVMVSGSVQSPAGEVTSLTINGAGVGVSEAGTFMHPFTATSGINILEITATDAFKRTDEVAQSFAYGEMIHPSGTFGTPKALAKNASFWMGKGFFDDNDTSDLDDVASLAWMLMSSYDINSLLTNPLATQDVLTCTYEISASNITYTVGEVNVSPQNGGLAMTAQLKNLATDVSASAAWCPDCSGTVKADTVNIDAQFNVSITADGLIDATLGNVTVQTSDFDVKCSGGALSLVNFIINWFEGNIAGKLEDQMETMLTTEMGPALANVLSLVSSYTLAFDVPGIPGGLPATLKVDVGINDLDLTSKGAAFDLDVGIGAKKQVSGASFGSIVRGECGLPAGEGPCCSPSEEKGCAEQQACDICVCGADDYCCLGKWDVLCVNRAVSECASACACPAYEAAVASLPKTSHLEVMLQDDLANQILHSLWYGGFTNLTLTDAELAPYLGDQGVSNMVLSIQPLLAPALTTCTDDGKPEIQVGDLKMEGTFALNGNAASFSVFASLRANMQVHIVPVPGGPSSIGGEVLGIEKFAVDVQKTTGLGVVGDTLLDIIMTEVLADYLLSDIITGMAAAYPVPSIDLGGIVPGIPVGTEVTFTPLSLAWEPGYLLMSGQVYNP